MPEVPGETATVSASKALMRDLVTCPLCQRRVSLHYLRYRHACKRARETTDESRERALQIAVSYLRERLAKRDGGREKHEGAGALHPE